jgi:hypothetical protein
VRCVRGVGGAWAGGGCLCPRLVARPSRTHALYVCETALAPLEASLCPAPRPEPSATAGAHSAHADIDKAAGPLSPTADWNRLLLGEPQPLSPPRADPSGGPARAAADPGAQDDDALLRAWLSATAREATPTPTPMPTLPPPPASQQLLSVAGVPSKRGAPAPGQEARARAPIDPPAAAGPRKRSKSKNKPTPARVKPRAVEGKTSARKSNRAKAKKASASTAPMMPAADAGPDAATGLPRPAPRKSLSLQLPSPTVTQRPGSGERQRQRQRHVAAREALTRRGLATIEQDRAAATGTRACGSGGGCVGELIEGHADSVCAAPLPTHSRTAVTYLNLSRDVSLAQSPRPARAAPPSDDALADDLSTASEPAQPQLLLSPLLSQPARRAAGPASLAQPGARPQITGIGASPPARADLLAQLSAPAGGRDGPLQTQPSPLLSAPAPYTRGVAAPLSREEPGGALSGQRRRASAEAVDDQRRAIEVGALIRLGRAHTHPR